MKIRKIRRELSWETSSETNSSVFEIEHSTNGKSWENIGNVLATGQSNGATKYDFTHQTPQEGLNLYRLKMIDLDGTFAYSSIRSVTFNEALSAFVYPNPVVNTRVFSIRGLTPSDIEWVRIYDAAGKLVFEKSQINTAEISVSQLNSGNYAVRVNLKNGDVKI